MKHRLALAALLVLALVAAAPPAAAQSPLTYDEDFESYPPPGEPDGWFDSAPGNPVNEAPGQFKTWPDPLDAGNVVFGEKGAADGYTHYRTTTFAASDGFLFTGRMLRTRDRAHLGVTFFSDFPSPPDLYRLAQEESGAATVRLSKRVGDAPSGDLTGALDSGVSMDADVWYRFAILAAPEGADLRIRARLWPDGEPEPEAWQVDARDAGAAGADGWIGLWGEDPGEKYWDDLSVLADLEPPVILILESGAELLDGSLFNRPVVPVIEVTDQLPTTVEATLDGAPFTSGDTVSAEGVHRLEVVATDAAGNRAEASVGFEIDLTPPQFVAVVPVDGSVLALTSVGLSGRVLGADTLTVDGQPVPLGGPAGEDFATAPLPLAEGSNAFLLVAADRAGNVAQLIHRIVRDTTPPALTLDQPADGSVVSTPTVTVRGTVSDPHLAAVTVNGRAASLAGNLYTVAGVALAEGPNTLTAVALDTVGNRSQVTATVTLDTAPPEIRILESGAPLADGALFNRAVVPVVQVTDGSAVDVEVLLDGAPFVSGSTVSAEGEHTISVSALDAAGNSASASRGFTIDTTPPVFGAIQPADGTLLAATTATLVGQVTGGAVEVTVDGAPASLAGDTFTSALLPLAEGENLFELTARDAAGNTARRTHRLMRDTTPPVLTVAQPADGAVLGTRVVEVTGTAVDPHLSEVRVDGVLALLAGDSFSATRTLAEGPATIVVEALDSVGNRSEATLSVVVDTEPPVVRLTEGGVDLVDGTLYDRSVRPEVEVTDATETTVVATLDGLPFVSGSEVAGDGVHDLAAEATDAAGNRASASVSFEIDSRPPVFVSVAPPDGTVTGAAEVVLEVRVVGAETAAVDGVPVVLEGETFSAGPLPLAEGPNLFTLTAADRVGNQAERIHTVVRDATPPVVAITQPAAGALLGTPSVTVRGTVVEPNLATLTVNGVAATVTAGSWVAQQVPLAEGPNTLEAVATDAAGNVGTASVGVVLDTRPPEIAITDPAAGTVVPEAQVTVRGSVADPHLDRVEVDGVPAAVAAGTWSAVVPLDEGVNTLTAAAFDRLGNRGEDMVTVIRDSTAPHVEILTPAEGARLRVAETDVAGEVDDEEGIAVTVNGAAAERTGGAFTAAAVPLVEGENRLVARARDAVGNEGSHTRTVFVDTVPPELVASEPAAGALALAPSAVFDLTFSEPMAAPEAGALRVETAAGTALSAGVEADGAGMLVRPDQPLPSGSEVRLVLTAALTDLAGNPLAAGTLVFNTADVAVPDPPLVDPLPRYQCTAAATLSGTAEPEAGVEVAGGAGSGLATAGSDGRFTVSVALTPASLNRLSVTAVDDGGNRSAATVVEVVHDCRPPEVLGAVRDGDAFVVTFTEPVVAATVTQAGAITLSASGADLTGTVTPAADGTSATFQPAVAPPDETLRLAVAQLVRDRAGNLLAYPFARLFGGGTAPSFLVGTVIDDAVGRPLPGARVVVLASDGVPLPEPLPEATTGADGRFQIPVPPGTHDLAAGRPGYTPVYRVVTTEGGTGTDVFDPRPTPLGATVEVAPTGGTVASGGGRLVLLSGAVAAARPVTLTLLGEQGLPALLPYGWSPRGAAWVDGGEEPFDLAGELTLPVDAADGATLVVAALDLGTLQWRAVAEATVEGGAVAVAVPATGAYAAVEPDLGALAPPPAVVGEVLGSSPVPVGDEVVGADVTFTPEVVLPSQVSLAEVVYQLAEEAPSGVPLTLAVEETLTLLDGSRRSEAPYRADLVLYRAGDGTPRSLFRLAPSATAQAVPLSLGSEDVDVLRYGGETVRGNVLGPDGGSVTSEEGDAVDVPAGALGEPTAVTLERRAAGDLPLAVPAGSELVGVLALEMGRRPAAADLALRFAVDPPPTAGERGLVLALADLGGGPFYRPVAALVATADGWASEPIDRADLAWPGVREGGVYALVRFTVAHGYLRGRVLDLFGQPLGAAPVSSPAVGWAQISAADGSYVLPAPVGPLAVRADDLASGNAAAADAEVPAAEARVDLDLQLVVVAPRVIASTPTDGAVDVPPGVEPSLTFSEPVDRASLAAGIRLTLDGEPVPVTFDHQGALVRVLPASTLRPGVEYLLTVGSGVRDLQGNALSVPATIRFTTLRILLNEDVDATRILLAEPDADGMARVIGAPGAVPAFALVFVENTTSIATTTTVTADQDGSFEILIDAVVSDVLLLHVLDDNDAEVVIELTPFRTLDLRGAYVGPRGARFSTGDGVIVDVPPGAFDFTTLVRVVPQAPDAAADAIAPNGFEPSYAFSLDFGGAQANAGLRVSVPAPEGAEEGTYLLSRVVDYFGEQRWQMDDVGVLLDGRLTTEETPIAGQQIAGILAEGIEAASREGMARVRGGGLVARHLESALRQTAPLETVAAASRHREFLPGMFAPRPDTFYQFWRAVAPVGFLVLPFGPQPNFGLLNGDIGYVTAVDAAIARILPEKITIPSRLGQPFDIEVRDLTTGYTLFEGEIDPPDDEVADIELPADTFGDGAPPRPVSGTPLRFYLFDLATEGTQAVDVGVEAEWSGDALTVRGDPGTAHGDVQVRLLSVDSGVSAQARSSADGSYTVTYESATTGSYVLAVGARVASGDRLEIGFSEALAEGFPGIEVRAGASPAAKKVDVDLDQVGSRETVRITPPTAWRAGETYLLRLTRDLEDDAGNVWDNLLEVQFEVEESKPLGVYPFNEARDVARLGNLLFVAAAGQGIAVLDASNPAEVVNLLPEGRTVLFPTGASVRGVVIDPHGRLFATGGGDGAFPGILRAYDPLRLDPTTITEPEAGGWFMGASIISNGASGEFNLPPGTPRRTAVLSNDDELSWRFGEPPPPGVSVSPQTPPEEGGAVTVTVTGNDGTDHMPVSLRNLTAGVFHRVDAAAGGAYTVSVEARAGDRLELSRNRQAVGYVAVSGSGLAAVDLNAVWQERALGPNQTTSDVLNFFVGGAAAGGAQMATILNVALLVDAENPLPLTIPTGHLFNGFVHLQAPSQQPAAMQLLALDPLEFDGSSAVIGLETLQHYRFDLDGDGELEESEERDYLVIGHARAGVLIYDVTDRTQLVRKARVEMPGDINHVAVDRDGRRVFAAGYGGGLYVVDLSRVLVDEKVDADADGLDDRVIETVGLDGITRSPMAAIPDLGLLFVGGGGPGLNAIATGGPRLEAVVPNDDGTLRAVTRLAPFGVPTAKVREGDEESPLLPGAFRVRARLPGFLGPEVKLDVVSLGPGGREIFGAGDPDAIEGLPPTSLAGDDGLVLRRGSDDPKHGAFNTYVSEQVVTLADLRAARDYQRSDKEDEGDLCRRCDLDDENDAEQVDAEARQLLSGDRVAVRLPAELRTRLADVYTPERLDAAEIELASVRWEVSPAVRQEPTLNPSKGDGEAIPGTLLHSGEMTMESTDLFLKGRGFDFSFDRTYRSQGLGSGPLGPGWDHVYNQRLRELPDGSVELYDGRGRREIFKPEGEKGELIAKGRFVKLERTAAGWVLIDAPKRIRRFDRFGRLTTLADPVKVTRGDETGTELDFFYDLSSRLVRVEAHGRELRLAYDDEGRIERLEDFTGREVSYKYDADGRLMAVTSPAVTIGESKFPEGLTTSYEYALPSGDLAGKLVTRDNLEAVTDARGDVYVELTYTDADGDGRDDEATGQRWGGDPLQIDYQFAESGTTTTVTDRRGNDSTYVHNTGGQVLRHTDQEGFLTVYTYDGEGNLESERTPRGRLTEHKVDQNEVLRRARGNVSRTEVTPGEGGGNGSGDKVATANRYDKNTNQLRDVGDARGFITRYERDDSGLPTAIHEGFGTPDVATTRFEYNDFGQPTRVTNPNGHVTEYEYYEAPPRKGLIKSVTIDPGGLDLTTTYEVDLRGNVTAVTDPRGVRHEYVFNELDWLVEERLAVAGGDAEALDYRTVYVYDEVGNLTEVREAFGDGSQTIRTQADFGSLGEVEEIRREITPGAGDWSVEVREYDENRNVTAVVGAEGQRTTFDYNPRNLVETRRRAVGSEVQATDRYEYNSEGQLTLHTDPRGFVWERRYDGFGRISESIDPLGNRTATSYDAAGNPRVVKSFDAEGVLLAQMETVYDALGRAVEERNVLWEELQTGSGDEEPPSDPPAGAGVLVTATAYDAASNVVSVTDPRGNATRFEYDAAERLHRTTDAAGNEVVQDRDGSGNVFFVRRNERLPDGGTVTTGSLLVNDALGRTVRMTDGANNVERFAYDARDNLVEEIDGEGNLTVHEYDGLDRRTRSVRPGGLSTRWAFDRASRLLTYTDALGQTTRWTYDALDRPRTQSNPDATSETLFYDENGNLEQHTDARGVTVVQAFDDANRLIGRSVLLAPGVEGVTAETYLYDGLDRMKRAISGSVVSSFTYDSLSRLTSETTAGRTVDYSYDGADNLVGMQLPSGQGYSMPADALNRLSAIEAPGVDGPIALASFDYRGRGLVATSTVGPFSGTMGYDGARRRVSATYVRGDGTPVFDETVSWSARHLKTASLRGDLNGAGRSFRHDAAGRLTEVRRTGTRPVGLPEVYGFRYDAADNLLEQTFEQACEVDERGLPLDDSGRNRPGSVGGTPLAWDAAGNLEEKGDLELVYDFRNRLVRVRDSAGDVARYEYDAFNRRVRRIVGGVTWETAWAGVRPVEEYRDGSLWSRRTYGLGVDEMVRLEIDLDGGGLESYVPLYDSTGNLVSIHGGDGRLIERYEYTPYGERQIFVDSTPPAVEQVRVVGDELWIEVSEPVLLGRLEAAAAAGDLVLRNVSDGVTPDFELLQPVETGRQAGRRLVLRRGDPEDEDWPVQGQTVSFEMAAGVLVDLFENADPAGLAESFVWPVGDGVVADEAAPRLDRVCLQEDGVLEVTFSEEVDLADAADEVRIDGQPVDWVLSADRYTLVATGLEPGVHTLTAGTGPLDLDGRGLAATFGVGFSVVEGGGGEVVFDAPLPGRVASSTIGNAFGFQGLHHDAETGLVYVRNRYYDPEMGRFVSADPAGFEDGPNRYQFALNNPADSSDPMGLLCEGGFCKDVAFFFAQNLLREAVGTADFLSGGLISGVEVGIETYRGTAGTDLTESQRLLVAYSTYQRQRRNVQSLGFSEAEDKVAHAKLLGRSLFDSLTGADQFRAAAADFEGGRNVEGSLRVVAGTGALVSTLAGVVGTVKAVQATKTAATVSSAARIRINLVGQRSLELTRAVERSARTRAATATAKGVSVAGEAKKVTAASRTSNSTRGATRTGVVRKNAKDWRRTRDLWDESGYGDILSKSNRRRIAKGRTPVVDEAWVKYFPEDAGLLGERISMHHIQGSPITVPLPATRHLDAHMPGGFRYNPGGPGSAVPSYPRKPGS